MFSRNKKLFNYLQRLLDSLAAIFFWYMAYIIRFKYIPKGQQGLESTFINLLPVIVLTTAYAFHNHGLYSSQRFSSKFREILSLIRANIFAVISFIVVLYFFSEVRISRLTIIIYLIIIIKIL